MSHLRTVFAAALALAGASLAVPAAQAAAPTLFIQGDTVRGFLQGMTSGICVLDSQFKHKEEIIFRARVLDAKTGKALANTDIKSLVVELSDGQKFPMHYGKHPPQDPVAFFWSFGWTIPANYPTGSFGYKIVATDKKGHTATFEPFESKESQLTVMADAN